MRSNEIRPGDLIAGKFRVRAILGRTHGLLVEAFHTEFDQQVIIKILPAAWGDEKEIERFRREARTLAKLESEHVARIIDVGSQEDGAFYLVRQYLEGMDLGTYLRQRTQLPLEEATLLILQAAEAVAETHSHGIICRELQPSSLFLTQRLGGAPLVKIIDFGTAKLMRDAAAPNAGGELTATAMFGLSPYTSPELVRKAKNVDQRTDVWSLGAMLYEMLTGRPPFNGDMAVLMLQITKEEPVPATQYRPDLPADLDQILGWAMAKDVDGRFRNVHAFAHALTPFANAEGRLLIERIGQITHAAKKKKTVSVAPPGPGAAGSGYLPPPTPPPGRPRPEDSVTNVKAGGVSTQALPAYNPAGSGAASGFPPPSGGAGGPRSNRTGPSASRSGGPMTRSDPTAGTGPSTVQPATMKTASSQPAGKSRKVIYGLLAAAAVVVPILVTIIVLKKPGGDAGQATADSTKPIEIPVTSTTSEAMPPEPPSSAGTPEPPPSAVASTTPTTAPTTAPTSTAVAVAVNTPPPTGGGTSKPPSGGSTGGRPPAKPPEPKEDPPEPAPSGGGGNGTIVAVASGGSCSFTVNGASKGSGTSIRVSVSPGTYSVSCKPSGGGAKSKSVTVKSGQTAFAAFRLGS